MRATAQGAVERVAVGVGEAGHGQSGEVRGVARWCTWLHGHDAVAVERDEDVGLDSIATEPRQLAVVRSDHDAIFASAVHALRSPATQAVAGRSLASARSQHLRHGSPALRWRAMTVRWLTTFLDRPAQSFGDAVAFWTTVTGSTLSPTGASADEFATLVPADGDAYLRMQRVLDGSGGCHPRPAHRRHR